MANLGEGDTNVPGTIFISTGFGSHCPRIWNEGEQWGRHKVSRFLNGLAPASR